MDSAHAGNADWKGKPASSLKTYAISDDTYTGFGDRITAPVLSLSKYNTGTEDRFYVMALEDVTYGERTGFYWYYAATDLGDIRENDRENDFGKGAEFTADMIEKWNGKYYGSQNGTDLWPAIQSDEVNEKWKVISKDASGNVTYTGPWFVPSQSEWGAFGYWFTRRGGYGSPWHYKYDMAWSYWSSSIKGYEWAYYTNFSDRMGGICRGIWDLGESLCGTP